MTRVLCGVFLWFISGIALAGDDGHPFTMWHVAGETNSVYLLGSIHLLRKQDHPLPTVIDEAYADADIVVMELDMDDMDPMYAQAASNKLGVRTDGTTLRDLMGDDLYAQAEDAAAAIDIPLDMLDQSEPWLAAITVEIMMLYRVGFNPLLGVEMTMTQRAVADGKPIEGLETVDEQLSFLDNLPIKAQRQMLLQTLIDGGEMAESIDELVDAWHHGDIARMEETLLTSFEEQAELNDALLVSRNLRWTETISDWLDDDRDYLVVVGALHLIGDTGVPALLAERGFGIHQLSEPATVR